MSNIRMILVSVSLMLLLSACSVTGKGGSSWRTSPAAETGAAEQKLYSGIRSYEEGDYNDSLNALSGALEMGLSRKGDQVLAYKYSAFIHCASGREKQCRDAFRKTLEIEPAFDLKPAEAGHPLWGPVFRSVKGKPSR